MAEPSTRVVPPPIPGVEELEPVGRGGFAVVYRGWQPEYQRHVAVKVLEPSTDPAVVGRFRREVRAMGAVSDHPNVVPIYGAGVVDGRGYMVMPLLSGGTLDDKIRSGPLDAPEVVRIGRALADALAASHQIGLLHRDVKPANVLFTAYGDPQLADFGIARFADATATYTGFAATVAYAAPEVLQGEPATPASDVYSLGATLHAALRGEAPFRRVDGEPAVATAMRVLSDEPAHLKAAGVPAALAAVVERAMAKDPAHRYPTAQALRHALDDVDLGIATRKRPTAAATIVATEPSPARNHRSRDRDTKATTCYCHRCRDGTHPGLAAEGGHPAKTGAAGCRRRRCRSHPGHRARPDTAPQRRQRHDDGIVRHRVVRPDYQCEPRPARRRRRSRRPRLHRPRQRPRRAQSPRLRPRRRRDRRQPLR